MTCSGKLADIAKNYIKKGSKLLIEGFPSVNAYTDRSNNPVGTLRLYANNIEFISSAKEDSAQDNLDYPS